MISTNHQAKINLENAKPSKTAKVMGIILLSGIAILSGATTALYLINNGTIAIMGAV